jgi:glycyl-tRNA synthetase
MMGSLNELARLCFKHGFVLKNNNPYSLRGIWEYGHLGVLLRQNIKASWWRQFVSSNPRCVGFEGSILNHNDLLSVSGHLENFAYAAVKCAHCRRQVRLIELLREVAASLSSIPEEMDDEQLKQTITENHLRCKFCGLFTATEVRRYSFLFSSKIGPHVGQQKRVYLRPETAEGLLVKLGRIARIHRLQVPCAIGQIGYVFRNEMDPGHFLFRVRSFEQMELETIVAAGTDSETMENLISAGQKWYQSLGVSAKSLRVTRYRKADFTHALKADADIDVEFGFGWEDVLAVTNRKDYDLKRHLSKSGRDIRNLKSATGELPFVVELSTSVERAFLASLSSAYTIEAGERVCLRFPFHLAPIKLNILPVQKRFAEQTYTLAQSLRETLKWEISVSVNGSVGKRYYDADEIGTPFNLSYDAISAEGGPVLIRHRNTKHQDSVKQANIVAYLNSCLTQEDKRSQP